MLLSSVWACVLSPVSIRGMKKHRVRQKPYNPTLAAESDPKMCQKNERCFPKASLQQIRIVWKLAAGSCAGFFHTKHSFLLSPTPTPGFQLLIKPINRWWHDTRSVIEKQKNMSVLCKKIRKDCAGTQAAVSTDAQTTARLSASAVLKSWKFVWKQQNRVIFQHLQMLLQTWL